MLTGSKTEVVIIVEIVCSAMKQKPLNSTFGSQRKANTSIGDRLMLDIHNIITVQIIIKNN